MADEGADFWKVPSDDPAFWDAYVSTRPVYSQGFYDRMFDYHAEHSSTWEVAHDIGCGAGQLTAKLVPRFEHVIGSDVNATHVDVARRNLEKLGATNVSWTTAKGEEMLNHAPADSTDLIVVAEVMPIMDEAAALHSFHTLLRPGGSLAITFYGCPTVAEPEYSHCQTILDDIMEYHWTTALRPNGSEIPAGLLAVLSQAANSMASWLDYVRFDPALWTDVQRVKWNPQAQLYFFGEKTTGVPVVPVSNVTAAERVLEYRDPTWWCNDWTIADLKRYFRVLFPGFEKALGGGTAELDQKFDNLEKEMGGPDAVRKITWPTVLLLATKK